MLKLYKATTRQTTRHTDGVCYAGLYVELLCFQVTLPLLVLDLYQLAYHATGGAESWLNSYLAATLIFAVVLLGSIYHFCGTVSGVKQSNRGGCLGMWIEVFGFVSSCSIFGIVISGILHPLDNELCAPYLSSTASGTCPITDELLKRDATAVRVFTWVWIGYPLVSALSRVLSQLYSEAKNTAISLFKDVAYGVLDVVAKSGLALYVCYRTLHVW